MTRVYFPLRSNVNWFQSQELRTQLDVRLKEVLLLYDEVVIEDGTFIADITEKGGLYPFFPPGSIPEDQRVIQWERDISPTDIKLGFKIEGSRGPFQTLLAGKTIARYKIDFFDLTRGSRLYDADFVTRVVLSDTQLQGDVLNAIRRECFHDQSRLNLDLSSGWIRDLVIKSLNRDAIVASIIRAAVIVDPTHEAVLRQKCYLPDDVVPPGSEEQIALQHVISVAAPDFASLSIDDVLELREDRSWYEFRTLLGELVVSVLEDPTVLSNRMRFEEEIGKSFSKTLLKELSARYRDTPSLAINLGLGFASNLPGVGIPAALAELGKGVADWLMDRRSWLAFLLKIQAKTLKSDNQS